MYVSEQYDLMDIRLEDSGRTTWPLPVRMKALQNAQVTIVNKLHNNYLTELQCIEESVTVTDGAASIAGLSNRVVRGAKGIVGVKVSGGRWSTEIELGDAKKQESGLLKATVFNPQHYMFKNNLYVLPVTITAVDVYYLKMPGALIGELTKAAAGSASATAFTGDDGQNLSSADDAYNGAVIWESETDAYHVVTDYVGADRTFTVTPGHGTGNFGDGTFKFVTDPFNLLNLSGVESELNQALHELMVDLAVAECFESGKDLDRWKVALEKAQDEINTLNARYTDAEGIGTDRKGR